MKLSPEQSDTGDYTMKPLVIYHKSCADGFGAAFAAWLKLGDDAFYVPYKYGDDTIPDAQGREVYILDFSFPRDVMELIFHDAARVVWLDHHRTSFRMRHCDDRVELLESGERYGPRHYRLLDNNKSGAYLAWEYFHPGTEVPMLIRHIDDYARWVFAIDGTKEFNKALWSGSPWNFQQWAELLDADLVPMYKAGKAILRAHEQNVQSVVKGSARKCELEFNEQMVPSDDQTDPIRFYEFRNGLAVNCPPHLTSDVGHELAAQSGTFGLCWCLSKEGMEAQCSLRSNGDYDVSVIAKAFGGGGHKNAAGFRVPITTLLGWLK